MMKSSEFVRKAIEIAKNHKTIYMLGVFGAPVTESTITSKSNQYSTWYTAAKQALFRGLIGKNYFGFDCVCLIKAILWGWSGDSSKKYGGASYASNGVPDIGADSMIAKCLDATTGGWANIEPGEVVWTTGHIGIYIGDGLVVECTPKWSNNVQITALGNIGNKAGYNTRTWKKHGHLPYVDYSVVEPPKKEDAPAQKPASVSVGDIVTFNGTKHYASANSSKAVPCRPGKAKVTQIYHPESSKHPYHLVREKGGTSNVYGWVDAADIWELGQAQSKPEQPETFKVGDIVEFTGNTHYVSANAAQGKPCKGGKAKITRIYQLGKSKHPYHLVRVGGDGATVYGWVDADTFLKV